MNLNNKLLNQNADVEHLSVSQQDKEILELVQDGTAYDCIRIALEQFFSHLNLIPHAPQYDTHDLLNTGYNLVLLEATKELLEKFTAED
jgi:hypothetical protein